MSGAPHSAWEIAASELLELVKLAEDAGHRIDHAELIPYKLAPTDPSDMLTVTLSIDITVRRAGS